MKTKKEYIIIRKYINSREVDYYEKFGKPVWADYDMPCFCHGAKYAYHFKSKTNARFAARTLSPQYGYILKVRTLKYDKRAEDLYNNTL